MKHKGPVKLVHVDTFTTDAFHGNPTPVCILDEPRSEEWMQAVASELSPLEVSFVHQNADGAWHLRWFTVEGEDQLCGHGVLATAHALEGESFTFSTKSGSVTARKVVDGIELSLPLFPPHQLKDLPPGLLEALGLDPNGTKVKGVAKGQLDYLVEVEDEATLRSLTPSFKRVKKVVPREVIVTCRSRTVDFVSRVFAPAVGINEDAATGSAHCMLAPYWAEKLGKTDGFKALQLSPRGGELDLAILKDRLILRGKAITVFEGSLFV